MHARANAQLKATVEVKPFRSQVFLVALAAITGLSLIAAAWLFAAGNNFGWVFIAFALASLGGSLWAWKGSQSDIDLDSAKPTQLTLPDGTNVSTDSRLLRSASSVVGLVQIIGEMMDRKPLPEPSGLVDTDAKLIPNSKPDAEAVVNAINNQVQSATHEVLDGLRLLEGDPDSVQLPQQGGQLAPPQQLPSGRNAAAAD